MKQCFCDVILRNTIKILAIYYISCLVLQILKTWADVSTNTLLLYCFCKKMQALVQLLAQTRNIPWDNAFIA